MAKIDFYVMEQGNGQKSLFLACQLIEKAYEQQQTVYVHANSLEEAERFDAFLWVYREDTFIPHQIHRKDEKHPAPIQIGYQQIKPDQPLDMLINLSRDIPVFYSDYSRVIEIVFPDPVVQQLARDRFKHYRDQGHDIETTKIKAIEI